MTTFSSETTCCPRRERPSSDMSDPGVNDVAQGDFSQTTERCGCGSGIFGWGLSLGKPVDISVPIVSTGLVSSLGDSQRRPPHRYPAHWGQEEILKGFGISGRELSHGKPVLGD